MKERLTKLWTWSKWLLGCLSFLGGVYLAGWGAHAGARLFVSSVAADTLLPEINLVKQNAVTQKERIDFMAEDLRYLVRKQGGVPAEEK